ncbi:ankyrin repeat-containing domain protein [Microdochium trichocladiopsis]|uniref:Ankyrin repeat-containing domain protein n=1 Tax=Microdochium trichocladiopsis TaxID=1682393 RepID=A0A9P9BJ92_9PEZI|nr:ankyrin repeat-containing domain protein [Microdochium trichocladiopsis]KAH7014401.1 ankyrin repeat-containing domain protein [Microdochium trichocladiopsis]
MVEMLLSEAGVAADGHGLDDHRLAWTHAWGNKTPLHLAIRSAHFDVARLLLEHGADPGALQPHKNEVDEFLTMITGIPSQAAFETMLDLLDSHGAGLSAWQSRDNCLTTRLAEQVDSSPGDGAALAKLCFLLARGLAYLDLTDPLRDIPWSMKSRPLHKYVTMGDVEMIRRLLLEQSTDSSMLGPRTDPKERDRPTWSLLMHAVLGSHPEVTRILLDLERCRHQGEDQLGGDARLDNLVNGYSSRRGLWPLHHAITGHCSGGLVGSRSATARILIENGGADLERRTVVEGYTALLCHLHFGRHGPRRQGDCGGRDEYHDLLRFLLDAGGDATVKCKGGRSAWSYVTARACPSCATLVLRKIGYDCAVSDERAADRRNARDWAELKGWLAGFEELLEEQRLLECAQPA